MEPKFLRHKDCKTLYMQMGPEDINCLDNSMTELVANTQDAALEKHVPALEYRDGMLHVQVGSVEHPMLAEHFIQWIFVKTREGGMYKDLKPGDAPKAVFQIPREEIVAVYEYCNLHGLWKAELNQ